MATDLWFGMSPEERKKRAARHQGGGLADGVRIIKKASGKQGKAKK